MTRDDAMARYPGYNERYLAFLAASGEHPEDWTSNGPFMAFIDRALSAYKKNKNIIGDSLSEQDQRAFTEWLWEHEQEYAEVQA